MSYGEIGKGVQNQYSKGAGRKTERFAPFDSSMKNGKLLIILAKTAVYILPFISLDF